MSLNRFALVNVNHRNESCYGGDVGITRSRGGEGETRGDRFVASNERWSELFVRGGRGAAIASGLGFEMQWHAEVPELDEPHAGGAHKSYWRIPRGRRPAW